ncbi:hypothetical protein JCM3774_003630 [Rhodotorula dairenensis]
MRLVGTVPRLLSAAVAAAATAAAAVAAAPSSAPLTAPTRPDQLTFAVHTRQSDHGSLLQLEYDTRRALEQAVQRFEAVDADIWFAGKRRRTIDQDQDQDQDDPEPGWHALVRQESPLQDALEAAAQAGAVSGTAVSVQELLAANPTLSTLYSQTLSAASVANLTATVQVGDPIRLDDPIHETYHPYDSIHTIVSEFERAFPDWVEVITLGQSSQGREIWAVKVTEPSKGSTGGESEGVVDAGEPGQVESSDDDNDDSDESVGPLPLFSSLKKGHKKHRRDKLRFVVAGTQHAREWIAASTALYLMHELVALDSQGKVPHRKLLEQVEFTFVPVVNPDGYVYSWEHDRLWRKSRQPVGPSSSSSSSSGKGEGGDKECLGIDLNRNWGYKFQPGTRPNPCSDAYPGARAFESVELQALRDYMLGPGVDAFMDVHSFGQMLLFPYSYSCDVQTHDQENHYEAVLQAAKALRDVHGRVFETGSVCEVSLTSPGESLDWAYAVAKIRWSFATELRDGGIFGFLLPPAQIRPSGEEMSAALHQLTQFVLDSGPTMVARSFTFSAFLAFVTLFQTCAALHGPFFPVRHNHGSHRSLLPSRRDALRARQAVAPAPTLASELLTRSTNAAIARHLRALENNLADVGEEVGRAAERVKRAVATAEDAADREYLSEMLHDAVYNVLNVVSAHAQIRALPTRLDDVARPAPAGVVPAEAARPSASARSRSKRMLALQKPAPEPVYVLEHTLTALRHLTEPVRQVLPLLPTLQREAIQAVLDELHDEAALLTQGILEGRRDALDEKLAMQNIAAQ